MLLIEPYLRFKLDYEYIADIANHYRMYVAMRLKKANHLLNFNLKYYRLKIIFLIHNF